MQKLSVLFVCRANICRSPMAEGILKHKLDAVGQGGQVQVGSAGVLAAPFKRRPDQRAQKVTLKHGIDISGLRSRRFTEKDQQHDYILVMDNEQLRYLADHYPEAASRARLLGSYWMGEELPVPDPYYGNVQGFDRVFELLDQTTDVLLEHLLAAICHRGMVN